MFFTPVPAANAPAIVKYSSDHLAGTLSAGTEARSAMIAAGLHLLAYGSAAAELHWYGCHLHRCHTVEIILMNMIRKSAGGTVRDMNEKK